MSKLTSQQEIFVNSDGGNLLVSASAGSGKTFTMIEKLKNLILIQKVPVQNLLVVTFTEAAASEMKHKLYFRLQQELSKKELTEQDMQYFSEQLFQIATADIGTLHSVCKKIVSKYFYEVNIEPAFSILANEEFNSVFNQALNKCFEFYIDNFDEEFYQVYELFSDKRSDVKLKNIITKFYFFLSEQTNADLWFETVVKECCNTHMLKNSCVKFLYLQYDLIVQEFFNEIQSLQKVVDNEKLSTYLASLKDNLTVVLNSKNALTFAENIEKLKFPTLNNPKDVDYEDIYEQLKNAVADFKRQVSTIKDKFSIKRLNDVVNNSENLFNQYKKLFEITKKVTNIFMKLKTDSGKLDFSDLQKLTLQILKNTEIRKGISQQYRYVFVDEYQDTNQIQEDILNLISTNNLNMIGDVKQSIYGFRQCMPEIFLSKYNVFKADDEQNKLVLLNKNFRCSEQVVDFVNFISNQLITVSTIGINYKKDAQLLFASGLQGEVNLKLINNGASEEAEDGEDDGQLQEDELEALKIVEIITEVYGKEFYDKKSIELNKYRQIDYGDIAILTRNSREHVNTLYKTLRAHKIPATVQYRTSLFDNSAVIGIYSLLKLLSNSNNDLDICNVLTGALINVTISELAEIKNGVDNDKSIFECVQFYCKNGNDENIIAKLNKYFYLLNDLKYRLTYTTIKDVIQDLLVKNNLFNNYLSFPDGEEVVEKIKIFIGLLDNKSFEYNIYKCLEFLQSLESKKDFEVSIEGGGNSVKIITMHKSKGLEYPCVILAYLGKSFNKSIFREDFVLTNKLGIGANFRDFNNRKEAVTIQKTANIMFEANKQMQEEIRLLYVALTRAENFLYLTGCYNFDKFLSAQSKPIMSARNFLDLIFKACGGGLKFNFINKKSSFELLDKQKNLAKVEIFDMLSQAELPEKNKIILSGEQSDVVKAITNNFKNLKPLSVQEVATKTSVTSLMQDDNYVNENEFGVGLKFNEKINNTPLMVGSAYHKIMQNLNYNENLDQVEKLIEYLFNSGQIELEVKSFIDSNKVLKAINSINPMLKDGTKILKEQQFILKTKYVREASNIKVEENKAETQDILVQGVIDLVLINDNNAVLIDFKTNKTKDINSLLNAYSLQLKIYKEAVEKGLNVNVVSSKLYMFESDMFVEVV